MTDQSVEKRREMKREKIKSVAQKLFLQKGFDNVSVEEITKQAGISKGSFYTYFKSKDELLKEIALGSIDALKEELIKNAKKLKDPVRSIKTFLETNVHLSEMYISGILVTLRELNFIQIKDDKLSALINEKIKDTLRDFIKSLKGSCSEEDVLLLWSVMLSVWIQIGIEKKKVNTSKLALTIWNGLGGERK